MSGDSPKNEELYKQLLLSEKWDVANAPAPRLRYAIFSLPRTGSELLCARLRLEGIGIPIEYFNTDVIAARLGCLDTSGNVDVGRYLSRLEAVRTTPNGVFGTKIQPRHLAMLSGGDLSFAHTLLRRFDKVVLLRRRDVLLQAISLARSHLTGQWHALPGDALRRVPPDDARLFEGIDAGLARIERAEGALRDAERQLERHVMREVYYEDMTAPGAIEPVVDWIASGLPRVPSPYATTPDRSLPRRGDAEEATAIKKRYLSRYPTFKARFE